MKPLANLFLILVLFWATSRAVLKYDDPRINILGSGFDILSNEPQNHVILLVSTNHSNPNTPLESLNSPENVVLRLNPSTNFQLFSQVFDKNTNIKDVVETNVQASTNFLGIGGSFSMQSKTMKTFVSKVHSQVTQTSSKTKVMDLFLETATSEPVPEFKARIANISLLLEKNTTVTKTIAICEVDELLRIYGTHVVVQATLGGVLSKMDAVDDTSYSTSTDKTQTMSASASASFLSTFKVGMSYNTEHADLTKYSSTVTDTLIQTRGGTWKPTQSYEAWVESVKVAPAPIELALISMVNLLDNVNFPKLSYNSLLTVKRLVENRIGVYMTNNRIKGCPDPKAKNYIPNANEFDVSLCDFSSYYYFGGLYSVSNFAENSIVNLLTQTYSCPTGYHTFPLLNLTYLSEQKDDRSCHSSWGFGTRCHHRYYHDRIQTVTYICLSPSPNSKTALFGGVYNNVVLNDLTHTQLCPDKYSKFIIRNSVEPNDVTTICLAASNSGVTETYSFGGMFSSQFPNGLNEDFDCPKGFLRHPVGTQGLYELNYCIKLGQVVDEIKVKVPGYGAVCDIVNDYYPINSTQTGQTVSILVDPLNEDDYFTQVANLAKATFSGLDQHNISDPEQDDYLYYWALANNITLDQDLSPPTPVTSGGTSTGTPSSGGSSSGESDGSSSGGGGDESSSGGGDGSGIEWKDLLIGGGFFVGGVVLAIGLIELGRWRASKSRRPDPSDLEFPSANYQCMN